MMAASEETADDRDETAMSSETFQAEVVVGHKDTHVVIVPFDPAQRWPAAEPVPLSAADDPRGGRGWAVTGTVDGAAFAGFVGRRYGRSYLILPAAFRRAHQIDEGDVVEVALEPTPG